VDTLKIIISGKVQGVFFRAFVKSAAEKLRLKGTVKNVDDNVAITATGEKNGLKALVKICKKGPSSARVDKIRVEEIPLQIFENFSIK